MDTRTGEIYDSKQFEEIKKKSRRTGELGFFKPMKVNPTPIQMARRPPKVGRNEPCPCGSGKKFKKCCLVGSKG